MFHLRPFQEDTVNKIISKIDAGIKRLILVAPTGAGKTVMASYLILEALSRGEPVIFQAHRKELVDQASKKLKELGIPHGVIMSGRKTDLTAPVQVASIQTIVRRKIPDWYKWIISDECHHAAAGSYQKIFQKFPNAVNLGLTATAYRADGSGLGDVYDDYVQAARIPDLMDQGYLARARYWGPQIPNLADVRKKGSDWASSELGEVMSKPKLIGDVVKNYLAIAGGEKAICFAVNKIHGEFLTDAFNSNGVPAAFIHDGVRKVERERILAWHRLGKYMVLVNVGILSEGYDDPSVSVCLQARPTMSVGLHIQQIGRVLRPFEDKLFAKVIDFAGNIRRLGMMMDHEVDLSSGLKKKLKRNEDDIAPSLKTCKRCFAIFSGELDACPACGLDASKPLRTIVTKDGNLKELTEPVCKCGSFDIRKEPSEKGTQILCAQCGAVLRIIAPNMKPEDYYKREYNKCVTNSWNTARAGIMYKNRYGKWPSAEVRRYAEN